MKKIILYLIGTLILVLILTGCGGLQIISRNCESKVQCIQRIQERTGASVRDELVSCIDGKCVVDDPPPLRPEDIEEEPMVGGGLQ